MGLNSLLFLLMFAKCLIIESQFFQRRYFHTGIECTGSMTCLAPMCYLTNQNDGASKINVGCTLLIPLMKINVQQITEERYGFQQTYRPIMSYPPSEWCQVMLESAVNPIYKFAVEVVSNSVPELLHICPYWGPVYASNMTLNMDKIFNLFPPGDYANTLSIFDDINNHIFKVRVFTTVR